MTEPEAPQTPELEFSKKYTLEHSQQYAEKHEATPARKFSDWREQSIARSSLKLAGNPKKVLDLPCGTGRFWPLLAEQKNRVIFAADNSEYMLEVARQVRAPEVVERIKSFQTSAFDIDLPDEAVDCIFCMRLLHHIGSAEYRAAMLKEFHRVTADTVCISLWVDGNKQARRRLKLEQKRRTSGIRTKLQNRFVMPRRQIEYEFGQAGFQVKGYFDFFRYFSMWRIYVLKKQ